MNIRCISVENYKLTEGKIYAVASETRDFYSLLNDNNVGVRYSKRLFEVVPEGAVQATPVAPPEPPRRTERDLVQSIEVNNGQVRFRDFENVVRAIPNNFARFDSNISCGVRCIGGINDQIATIDNFFNLDEDDFLTIRKALFTKSIEQYVQRLHLSGVALGVLSTNVTGQDGANIADEDILSVLDQIAMTTTDAVLNPNSDRNIKVWVLQSV
jgi:hypothetical protein